MSGVGSVQNVSARNKSACKHAFGHAGDTGSSGRIVTRFSDGLSTRVTFDLPKQASWFALEVSGHRIRQSVT